MGVSSDPSVLIGEPAASHGVSVEKGLGIRAIASVVALKRPSARDRSL